jgi:hypothetical protein
MRSRVSRTISIGPIRFLRSASRNSATVLASTPMLCAALLALRPVDLAAFRACCCRPRACPPFFAAARRVDADAEPPEERLLAAVFGLLEALLAPEERLVVEAFRLLEALLAPDERLVVVAFRLLADLLAPEERLVVEALRLPADLLAPDDRLLDERLLDPLDLLDPLLDLPLLRRSAIQAPLRFPPSR